MKQKYSDNLRRYFKTAGEDECWHRVRRCAKHILAAISFRETSEIAQLYTGSVILSPIGFYYSLFHMGVAMLYLDYSTPTESLKRIKHGNLQNLIQAKLVKIDLLSESYLELLKTLKELREHTNYAFGEYGYDFMQEVSELYGSTGDAFDMAIFFIDTVFDEVRNIFDFGMHIRAYIGDAKGDDLMQTYLSSHTRECVEEYLLQKNLTT